MGGEVEGGEDVSGERDGELGRLAWGAEFEDVGDSGPEAEW